MAGVLTKIMHFWPPHVSAAGHSGACNVCSTFDAAFAKLL